LEGIPHPEEQSKILEDTMKSISRVVFVMVLLVVLGGCSAMRGPELSREDIPKLERELNMAIDIYLRHTLNNCKEAHELYLKGESAVDCKWSSNLDAMSLSLPDKHYQKVFHAPIGEWRQNWCASSLAKTGDRSAYWVVRYRNTGRVRGEPCWPEKKAPKG
jgi:hypothetical protein